MGKFAVTAPTAITEEKLKKASKGAFRIRKQADRGTGNRLPERLKLAGESQSLEPDTKLAELRSQLADAPKIG